MSVMKRKLFNREARDELRRMGGIMASSEPLMMAAAQGYAPGGQVSTDMYVISVPGVLTGVGEYLTVSSQTLQRLNDLMPDVMMRAAQGENNGFVSDVESASRRNAAVVRAARPGDAVVQTRLNRMSQPSEPAPVPTDDRTIRDIVREGLASSYSVGPLEALANQIAAQGPAPSPTAYGDIKPGQGYDAASLFGDGNIFTNQGTRAGGPPMPTVSEELMDQDPSDMNMPRPVTIGDYGRTSVGPNANEIQRMNEKLDVAGIGPATGYQSGPATTTRIGDEVDETVVASGVKRGDRRNKPEVRRTLSEIIAGVLPESSSEGVDTTRRRQPKVTPDLSEIDDGTGTDFTTVPKAEAAGEIEEVVEEKTTPQTFPDLSEIDDGTGTDFTVIPKKADNLLPELKKDFEKADTEEKFDSVFDKYVEKFTKILGEDEDKAAKDKAFAMAMFGATYASTGDFGQASAVMIDMLRGDNATRQERKDKIKMLALQAGLDEESERRKLARLDAQRVTDYEDAIKLYETKLKIKDLYDDPSGFLDTAEGRAALQIYLSAMGDENLNEEDRLASAISRGGPLVQRLLQEFPGLGGPSQPKQGKGNGSSWIDN